MRRHCGQRVVIVLGFSITVPSGLRRPYTAASRHLYISSPIIKIILPLNQRTQPTHLLRLHINLRTTTTLIALSSHDLVVVCAESHTIARPSIEVVLHVDAATAALGLADRPILLKGPRAINGRLVGARRQRNIIVAAISVHAPFALRTAAGIVRAVILDDVVFYERVARPAVHGEVAVALGLEGAAIVDGTTREHQSAHFYARDGFENEHWDQNIPASTRVPALSANEVSRVAPCHGVLAAFAHGVLRIAAAIGPPRVEIAIMGTYGVGGGLTLLERCDVGVLALGELCVEDVEGCAEHAESGCAGEDKAGERDHCRMLEQELLILSYVHSSNYALL